MSVYLSINICIYIALSLYLSIYLSIYLFIHLSIYLSRTMSDVCSLRNSASHQVPFYLSICPSIIYLSIYLSRTMSDVGSLQYDTLRRIESPLTGYLIKPSSPSLSDRYIYLFNYLTNYLFIF